jgi:tellurite resistance protein
MVFDLPPASFLVATADGVFDKRERAMLADIGKTLEVSPAHLNAIIQEMLEE